MSRYIDWAGIITRLRKTPGVWELTFPDAPALRARTVQQRRAPDLHRSDGRLQARVTNRYVSDGRKRGDVWLRWVPERVNTRGGDDVPRQAETAAHHAR